MHLNIQRKYTIFIVSLILFITVVVCAISYQQFNRMSASFAKSSSKLMNQALSQEMERRGILISRLLAENLINPLYNYDQNSIHDLVAGFKSNNNVIGIYVYDAGGRLIHDGTKSVDQYGSYATGDREQIQKVLSNHRSVVQTRDGIIEIYHPVLLDQTLLGGIKVVLSPAEMQAHIDELQNRLSSIDLSERRESFQRLLLVLSILLLVGILLAYTLALRISIPITNMAKYAARVGEGNYENRLEYKAKDEIGELIEAFNTMQLNLTHSTVSIQQLETKVESRTRELYELNRDLKMHKEQLELKVTERTAELLEANERLVKEIEERRGIQEELIRAKKMEAIGMLAGAVAHDLNNILTGMVGIPDLILMNLPKDDPLIKDLLLIKKSGQRAAAVVQDLLNLARKNVVQNSALEMGSIVREYLNSPENLEIQRNYPGITIQTDIPPQKYRIMGSPLHLTKALMNLISNAAESMTTEGVIRVSLRNQCIERSEGKHDLAAKEDYVTLQVKDEGEGIPADKIERIFEPFYTTKAMGRSGSGLGLTVVWETVKDHNGYIDVQSTVGKGTAFTLYFPATKAEPLKKREEVSTENYRGNGEAILIVDDLESQRNLLRTIMRKLGYTAQTLPSGEDAIEYMKANSVDLVILDMMMAPGMNGLVTYQEIIKFKPGQKAIMVSGYSDAVQAEQLQDLGVETYIQKPYTVKQIGSAVRAVLDR